MITQSIFPAELVFQILSYTSPLDVVRWRTVSKWFRAVTHDPAIWKVLYANAHFIRPPGPFPTASFERALVRSARLAQSWTTQCVRTVSHVKIPLDGWIKEPNLIDGRWLIVCHLNRQFVLYDIDSNAETRVAQVLWKQGEKITQWDRCLATSEEGHYVVYVLFSTELPRWTLLEFRLDAESGVLCDTVTLDVPVSNFYSRLKLNGGRGLFAHSPFLSIPSQFLVFDTRTRVFHEFPKFRLGLDEIRSRIDDTTRSFDNVVPTNTHVIVLRCYLLGITLVQAFTVPDDQRPVEHRNGVLRLSHEGIFQGRIMNVAVIRNSIVDPTNGSISVRLLEGRWRFDGAKPTCIDLTLHKPSPVNVSLITIKQHSVIITDNIRLIHKLARRVYYDISDDGYARGLLVLRSCDTACCGIVKFTMDATQDRCVVVLPQFSHVVQNHVAHPINHDSMPSDVSWDGVRGRLSYTDLGADGQIIVVKDIE